MADFDRGIKGSLAAAAIYLAISVILSAIYQNNPSSLPYLVLGTGLTPLFLLRELADPSFVFPLLFQYLIRGLIFGAVFAALYSFLPGGASVKKGVVLSAFLWVVGVVWLIYVTPGWPADGNVTLIVVGLTVSLSSISLALVSLVSGLAFGALTGFLWSRFRGRELTEERKGKSVLRVSFVLGAVYWALPAVAFFANVVITGEIPPIAPDPWWGEILFMLVVSLGLPGWILTRVAWKKTKADKSGFKWGVAGGVLMALTGIMLLPGLLAIIGGVLSRWKPTTEFSTVETEQGMNRKKLIGTIVACAIVIGVVTAVAVRMPTKNNSGVAFADPKLEGVVRETIDIPEGPIYASDLGTLTSLVAYGMNIRDLAGLEYCVKMTELSLFDNQISDISLVAGLVKLTSLHLWENRIADISPLANLTRLEYLTVEGNQISDISPLEGLTELTWLYLGRNQIGDISALPKHSRLTWLSLWGNQITDISPLSNLTSLERLWLNDNQISDISPLVDNTGLGEGDTVYLQNNPLSDDSINIYIPQLEARGVTVYYQD
jgi:hypothetical protein